MRLIPATLAMGLFPHVLWADPTLECSTGASSQVEIGKCLAEMGERVDTALDLALEFARSSAQELDTVTGRPLSEPALATAQEAWETYRDAHCTSVGTTFGGGSGTGIAISACHVELGRARIAALMRMAN